MKQLFVIGDPVAHSLSPLLHQAMLDQTGAAYRYDVRTVRPEELPAFVRWAKDGGCAGFNVTMPHKEAILPLLDEVDTTAASCGAVNTVCIREGRAIGHNTDGTGFLDSLAGQGFYPQDRTVLLLGAGGAAKAVGHALATAGAGRVIVCARRLERAAALAAQLPGCGEGIVLAQDAIQQAAASCDLLVNATPLGMAGSPAFARLDFLQAMPPHAVVYDLVYHPRRTALLEAAARQGLRTVGGIDLLIRQAVRAFTFFTGETPDTAALYAALREPLGLA
ncbi:MAG: shikimate dehydrogenase [Oscillospiraceae bacterium]